MSCPLGYGAVVAATAGRTARSAGGYPPCREEREVGAFEERVGRVTRAQHRDAPAPRFGGAPPQEREDPVRVLLVGGRQHDDELVAADARDDVAAAEAHAPRAHGAAQGIVAAQVTVAVVDRLEAVEVDRGDCELLAPASRP